ncbi:hypothetical protein [Thermosulfurimonas sp. F29]|uniref:hypothetical protein n=1 Tax=Thermosulfurimonas sp. F29 TaxID=2867247 RepID=UPI001C83637E|nr:hypothetical protein [Thermosulfurimonas sp. F29]MBX6424127.1 hypothetical protein [Thermosulfurimonas sp. F29]
MTETVTERNAEVRRGNDVLAEAAFYENFVVEVLRQAIRESEAIQRELERFDRENRRELLAALLMLLTVEVPQEVAEVLSASGGFEVAAGTA